jgi:xylose isomerase
MHMNDNYRAGDLDMIFGSVHTIEFIEMFYWLRRTGYNHFMSIDLFAYRTDPAQSVAEGVRWMRAFDTLIDRLGMEALGRLIADGDPVKTSAFLRETLLDSTTT